MEGHNQLEPEPEQKLLVLVQPEAEAEGPGVRHHIFVFITLHIESKYKFRRNRMENQKQVPRTGRGAHPTSLLCWSDFVFCSISITWTLLIHIGLDDGYIMLATISSVYVLIHAPSTSVFHVSRHKNVLGICFNLVQRQHATAQLPTLSVSISRFVLQSLLKQAAA